jgi:predicted nucleic acid-binding protein
VIYLDACALVKLVRAEQYSEAMAAFISIAASPVVSSELARTEVHRTLWRNQEEAVVHKAADRLLTQIAVLPLTAVIDSAGQLPHQHLRSLDALHLATALQLGDNLSKFISYDKRLAEAAREQGLPALSPGAE